VKGNASTLSPEDKAALKEQNALRGKKASRERIISDRAAAESTWKFQERIKFRASHFNNEEHNPLDVPGIRMPGIREATARYLLTPPEADASLGVGIGVLVTLLSYAYTVFNQVSCPHSWRTCCELSRCIRAPD
jgi:hypothetical protein